MIALGLHKMSNDPELRLQLDLLPERFCLQVRLDPEFAEEVLKPLKLGTTPLAMFKYMNEGSDPKNLNQVIWHWVLPCTGSAIAARIDTSPTGQWRAMGSFLGALGVLGSVVGFTVAVPLYHTFGLLVTAGFMLHVVGFYRAGRDPLFVISRGMATLASFAIVLDGTFSDKAFWVGSLVLAAGICGLAEYYVSISRSRRYAGMTGSTVVAVGAAALLSGMPLHFAGALIGAGALINHSASLRQHLLELRYPPRAT
jgi:hypothetical protein